MLNINNKTEFFKGFFLPYLILFSIVSIVFIVKLLQVNTDSPNLMHNLGMALIAFLIPFWIYALRNEKGKNFAKLDLQIILHKYFYYKKLLSYFGMIFLPAFFWRASLIYEGIDIIKLLIVSIFCLGVFKLLGIVIGFIKWLGFSADKNNRGLLDIRYKFLEQIIDDKNIEAWQSVWQCDNLDYLTERRFFEVFYKKIESSMDDNVKKNIILIFYRNLKKRNVFFLLQEDTYLKLLDYFYKYKDGKSVIVSSNRYDIYNILEKIIVEIKTIAFKNNGEYQFCHIVNSHLKGKDKKYLEDLMHLFVSNHLFDEIVESDLGSSIFKNYLKDWQVTYEGWLSGNNIIRIIFVEYFNWSIERIRFSKNQGRFDKNLDSITYNLFPEIDPISWSYLLLYVVLPYDSENKLKTLVEYKKGFGFIGRIVASFNDIEKDFGKIQKEYINNSIKLARTIFPSVFEQNAIKSAIDDLEKIDYKGRDRDEKELTRKRLLELFNNVLNFPK
ncbi:MAG: hypothetical protein PHO91_03215 [Patescibacteria group bacterium]|nr:hypothetical protein [Patescibacteria group bacterium]